MCHTLDMFVDCAYCGEERAEVFQCCVGDTVGAEGRVGCNVDIESWYCDSIFTITDIFTDLVYVCGPCVGYASLGVTEAAQPPFSREYVTSCVANPSSTREYVLKMARESPLAPEEDGSSCGYVNSKGDTVVIICHYELRGDVGATVVYPRS